MKTYKLFLFILVSANAWALPNLEKEGSFLLYAAPDQPTMDFEVHYAGLGQWISMGQIFSDWKTPDCLILHESGALSPNQNLITDLVSKISVREGRGILSGTSEHHELTPTIVKGTYVYFLQDLGTFVTGIRFQTNHPRKTLKETISDVFGNTPHNLVVRYDRGCQLLN